MNLSTWQQSAWRITGLDEYSTQDLVEESQNLRSQMRDLSNCLRNGFTPEVGEKFDSLKTDCMFMAWVLRRASHELPGAHRELRKQLQKMEDGLRRMSKAYSLAGK